MNKNSTDSERATKKYEEIMTAKLQPVNESLNDVLEWIQTHQQDLMNAGEEIKKKMESKVLRMEEEEMNEYKIGGNDKDWSKALSVREKEDCHWQKGGSGIISIPSSRKRDKVEVRVDEKESKKSKKKHSKKHYCCLFVP